jgi:hypothetical protein
MTRSNAEGLLTKVELALLAQRNLPDLEAEVRDASERDGRRECHADVRARVPRSRRPDSNRGPLHYE